uniref:UDP-glucuronate decarboxylase n=1 Tax=Heterosigma akashiwo TaxID=2829 RepID=A0A6V1P8H7_HETAK
MTGSYHPSANHGVFSPKFLTIVATVIGAMWFGYLIGTFRSPAVDPETIRAMVRVEMAKKSEAIMQMREDQLATLNFHDRESTVATGRYPQVEILSEAERKRILVTGGAGFVGSHLVDRLMLAGHEVIVVDNMFTGRKQNVGHWFGHPHFTLVEHDVVEPIMLEVDQIYHLACPASPPHYQFNPIKTIKTSTEGTLNMLGLAKRVGARILLTSTSEVYGDPEVHPQREDYWGHVNPIGPRACYDEGKRVAETMMYAYHRQAGVEVRVARIFNTFGERMHPNDGRVVSNFIIQALQGKPLTVYGDGQQTRSFQYVADLVDGLVRLMNGDYLYPVNLGNPDEYTIRDFADYVLELTNSTSRVEQLPATQDDPGQRRPDISLARKVLGWQPRVNVKEGILRTVQYFKKELESSGEIIPTGSAAARPGYHTKQRKRGDERQRRH